MTWSLTDRKAKPARSAAWATCMYAARETKVPRDRVLMPNAIAICCAHCCRPLRVSEKTLDATSIASRMMGTPT
jgi:hypothetical protein